MANMTKVGFIGLGLMGNPMAKNILKAGFSLTVYNRTTSKIQELRSLGANIALTPADVSRKSDVVISMVTGPKDVNEVFFGDNGVVKGVHDGLTAIDMSTIGPTAAIKIANKLKKYRIGFLDAPVTGSTPKAITGELTIFIGGDTALYEKVRPVLLSMGKNLHHVGSIGSGQAIKLINNYLIASTIAALSEGMILADVVGLSRKKTEEILPTVPAMSPMMNLKLPNYVHNKFPLLFSMKNMYKDIELAAGELKKGRVRLSLFEKVRQEYALAMKKGLKEEDFSQIIHAIGNTTKS